MNKKFQLRTGKYAGKTIEWLQENDHKYLIWVEENRPEMLKGSQDEKPVTVRSIDYTQESMSSLQPNYNFYNEGPDELSKPYLEKMKQLNNKKDE